jgi:hypothetical protein
MISSIRGITSGVFFHGPAPGPGATDSLNFDVLVQQLSPPPGHGRDIEPEQSGNPSVTTSPRLQGFKPGVQPSPLLVEQAEEQDDGRPQFVWHDGRVGQGARGAGLGEQSPARKKLLTPAVCIGRAVEKLTAKPGTRQTSISDELAQSVFGADMEHVVEFLGEVPAVRALHERSGRREESPVDREPDVSVRPQPQRIELGDAVERVEAAAMRVARAVAQLVQFSEHGAPSIGAQRGHQLGQGGDLLLTE